MPLADARRSSRVAAVPAHVRFTERLVGAPGEPLPGSPDAVVVDPTGRRIAASYSDRTILLEPFGARIFFHDRHHPSPQLLEERLRIGDEVIRWDGQPDEQLRPASVFDETGFEVASDLRGDVWTFAGQLFRSFGANALHVHVRTQGQRDATAEAPRWRLVQDGLGTAAIAADGRVAVSMQDGRFTVLGPSAPPSRIPTRHAEVQLDYEPYAVSAIGGGFVVLCAEDSPMPGIPGGDFAARIYRCTEALQLRWNTRILAFDADGNPSWQCRVPFSVRQPAIEWDDAVALVGESVARVENGHVAWTRPAGGPAFATATGGGLVVASSRYVDIVGTDGVVGHRFAFNPDIQATTPPAISCQGWIAQGTSDGIYVLR